LPGSRSVTGTVITYCLELLGDGFTLRPTNSYLETVILGVALITAVLVDQAAQRFSASSVGVCKPKEPGEMAIAS